MYLFKHKLKSDVLQGTSCKNSVDQYKPVISEGGLFTKTYRPDASWPTTNDLGLKSPNDGVYAPFVRLC